MMEKDFLAINMIAETSQDKKRFVFQRQHKRREEGRCGGCCGVCVYRMCVG